jgi:integrase
MARGYGRVYLPFALACTYPNADRAWGWQYVVPSDQLSRDPPSGVLRRHHLDERGLQKAVHRAAHTAGITKRVSYHTFRHSFAIHLIQNGYGIRTKRWETSSHVAASLRLLCTYATMVSDAAALLDAILPAVL